MKNFFFMELPFFRETTQLQNAILEDKETDAVIGCTSGCSLASPCEGEQRKKDIVKTRIKIEERHNDIG